MNTILLIHRYGFRHFCISWIGCRTDIEHIATAENQRGSLMASVSLQKSPRRTSPDTYTSNNCGEIFGYINLGLIGLS